MSTTALCVCSVPGVTGPCFLLGLMQYCTINKLVGHKAAEACAAGVVLEKSQSFSFQLNPHRKGEAHQLWILVAVAFKQRTVSFMCKDAVPLPSGIILDSSLCKFPLTLGPLAAC